MAEPRASRSDLRLGRGITDAPGRTLGIQRHGGADPTTRLAHGHFWRAAHTPDGPGTLHVSWSSSDAAVHAEAWGPGASWCIEHVPDLLGAADDPTQFRPCHPLVAELARRFAGHRLGRSLDIHHAMVPTVLGQRVTTEEAERSWASLVRTYGEPAPGPSDPRPLRLPPTPQTLAALPYFTYHRFGVERSRADIVRTVSARADRLAEAVRLDREAAAQRLQSIPGVGPWTAGTVRLMALGDPDAVPVGDFHLCHVVTNAFTGKARGSDAEMLELLAPFEGQRGRVVRWLLASGARAPRLAPRRRNIPIARL